MRTRLLLLMAACVPPDEAPDKPADDVPMDTDVIDTDVLDTDVIDTDAPDTDVIDTDAPDPTCTCADDGDPCTVDACDASGTCTHEAWGGDPLALFDLDAIRDPATLDLQVLSTETELDGLELVRIQELRYTSWESDGCVVRPIRIEAYLALPQANVGRPTSLGGLVVAHGLGGYATSSAAVGPAADHGLATIAFSGPGQGQSEGWGSEPDHLFDVLDVPSDAWFAEHAVAAMRAVTVLQSLPEVQDGRVALTGYSGGGVATIIANGVDDRLAAAIPVSATGFLDVAARNDPPGWQTALLGGMTVPQTPDGPAWRAWEASIDPRHFLPTAHGLTLLINGAQDEFFPITSTSASFAALQGTGRDHRLTTIVDWDHGWFALFNSDTPIADTEAALGAWLDHIVGDRTVTLPPQPVLRSVSDQICDGPVPCVEVVADVGFGASVPRFDVVDVQARVSVDGLLYLSVPLSRGPRPRDPWTGTVPFATAAQLGTDVAVWFVDVKLREAPIGRVFRVSSLPSVPVGFQPDILPIDGPIPSAP